MECLSSLILMFAGLSTPTTAPILTILLLLSWKVKLLRPCHYCVVVMYTILVGVLLFEAERGAGKYVGGLFDSLRITPSQMELNLLARVRYDPPMGFVHNLETSSVVFCPRESFANFFKAFLRYLVEPNYGKLYRQ